MNISADYEKILLDNLKNELDWLEQEFDIIFKFKKDKYTESDISVGNKILSNVIENIKNNRSEELLNLLAITLNKIEKTYPEFF